MPLKDFLGQELNKGDIIIWPSCSRGLSVKVGKILNIHFTRDSLFGGRQYYLVCERPDGKKSGHIINYSLGIKVDPKYWVIFKNKVR